MNALNNLSIQIEFKFCDEPFPHLYIENILPENIRQSLINAFSKSNFTTALGGSPVHNINDGSDQVLIDFRDSVIKKLLIPSLDSIFVKCISEKKNELEKLGHVVKQSEEIKFGFLHLTKNLPGTTINSHRDDERATYQFIFYLGDINGGKIDITELVYPNSSLKLNEYETSEFTKLHLKSFPPSKNSFMCFSNQPHSYHCLSKMVKDERLTLVGSVIHYKIK